MLARDQRARALEESLVKLGAEGRCPDGDIDFEQLPMVERARLEALNAKSKYDRGLPLHARTPPLISDQDLADLKVAWDTARERPQGGAPRRAHRPRRRRARARPSSTRRSSESRTRVHVAPDRSSVWLVGERLVAAGSYVSVGAPLYRLVDADPLRLRIRVPERKMAGIVAGKEALVRRATRRPSIVAPRHAPQARGRSADADARGRDRRAEREARCSRSARSPSPRSRSATTRTSRWSSEKAIVVFAGIRKVFVPDQGQGRRAARRHRPADRRHGRDHGRPRRRRCLHRGSAGRASFPGAPDRGRGRAGRRTGRSMKLAEICIRRPTFAAMLSLALIAVGVVGYAKLGVDRFPAVDLPSVIVRTRLPGASPEEVETEVTDVLEEAVNTVEGIDQLRSISGSGQSWSSRRSGSTATSRSRRRTSATRSRASSAASPARPIRPSVVQGRRPTPSPRSRSRSRRTGRCASSASSRTRSSASRSSAAPASARSAWSAPPSAR